MTDFLLELRSEEIPARMQLKAKDDLARLFAEALARAGLVAEGIETFATPRRLALIASGLPLETEAVSEETKGPKVGAPPQAMEGFLRKTGLMQDQLVERDGVYFAVVEKPGRKTADVLAEAIPAIVRAFPWPKSMRWGAASLSTESLRWVRPLQGIVALLGDEVVPCEVGGVVSGRETMGHRFHSSGPVSIANAAAYVDALRGAHVLVHFSERCGIIRNGAQAAAAKAGLALVEDEGLVVENAGLTEWPVPMLGRFDPAFLEVPEEVIQLTARVNQKYFICRSPFPPAGGAGGGPEADSPTPNPSCKREGDLANAFVCTANLEPNDGGAAVVEGNEKVLAARLSDAKFFWEQDLKVPLERQAEKLKDIVFHEKLGTVADKVERVAKLARWLVEEGIVSPLPAREGPGVGIRASGANPDASEFRSPSATPTPNPSLEREGDSAELADQAERAARLCKADLVTGMVGEFPELQGVMGGYYARAQGENDAVADAIRDHYKPVGQGDEVPTAPVTVAVSLADKLDTIGRFFFINEKPTGSKDPFALRRAALGILSLLTGNGIRCSIWQLLEQAFPEDGDLNSPEAIANTFAMPALKDFFADRLKVQQREAGVRHDLIDAVFALGGEDDLVRLLARVKALQAFVETPDGTNLLAGYKRAANILKQSPLPEREGPGVGVGEADQTTEASGFASLREHPPLTPPLEGRGMEDAESALLKALDAAEPKAAAAVEAEDFEGAMAALASLRAPIDAFFDGVMVNDPDPQKRAFRLGLLARFRDAVHRVADFSKIEG